MDKNESKWVKEGQSESKCVKINLEKSLIDSKWAKICLNESKESK